MNDKTVKLLIGIPSGGTQKTLFSQSFMNCYNYTSQFTDINISIRIEIAPYICRNRCEIVEVALENGHDFVLFLDNDMMIPPETIVRLLQHDVDVVTTNYVTKNIPARFMAVLENTMIKTGDQTGLEQVDLAPTGTMLIKTDVFRKIKKPFFFVAPKAETISDAMAKFLKEEYDWLPCSAGEDYWFCHLCKLAGIKVWIDHDLSRIVSHIGDYPYSYINGWDTKDYTQQRLSAANPNTAFILRK